MARYISDQNKVVLIQESGTYAVTSGNGVWIGEVTESSMDDVEGKIEDRYLGTATRNFNDFVAGPRDVTGTITYNTQDFRIPLWAIGSVVDSTAAGIDKHIVTENATNVIQNPFTSGANRLNNPMSFTIEDSKQSIGTGRNFIRTVKGCVPNIVTITATQGEKVSTEVQYIGQTLSFSSGTTTSVTETLGSNIRPYLWSDASIKVAGSTLSTVKEVTFEINNNIEAPHYINGSRDISVPIPMNKEYRLGLTLDLDGTDAAMLYNTLYKNNASFNAILDFNADGQVATAGSAHAIFTMSGCIITAMDNPSLNEGTNESTVEIRPKSVNGSVWDQLGKYNPY